MASPLPTRKPTVNLASGEVRVSKIRRDPPPAVKPKALRHPDEVNRSAVIVGVLAFALAIFVIILAVGSYNGWSPRQYTIDVKL